MLFRESWPGWPWDWRLLDFTAALKMSRKEVRNMAKKVFLDPGHGGSDSGAVANGLKEKDLTLKIAKATEKYLKEKYEGVTVKMSRTGDSYPSLSARAK